MSAKTVYNSFDALWYDGFTALTGFARAPRRLVRIFTQVAKDLPQDAKVLDFGCGTGRLTAAFTRACKNAEVTGIEPSEAMAELFREKLGKHPRVKLVMGGCDANFPASMTERYDVAAATGVFDHLEITPNLMRKFLSVVKPGGYAAFTYERHHGGPSHKTFDCYHTHTEAHVRQCLEDAGATVLRESRMLGYITPHVARYGIVIAQKPAAA